MNLKFDLKEYIKRYFWLFLGLFILSLGVALSTKANLGTSPIACVPYVLSLWLPLSMGTFTILLHSSFILLQIVVLRRDFKPTAFFQLITTFIFGFFTDLSMFLVSGLYVESIVGRWLLLLVSVAVIAFGVNLEVKANVLMLAGEGLILAISKVTKNEFGKCKTAFDCTLMATGAIISLLVFHKLNGVREGTVFAAIFVGVVIRFLDSKCSAIYRLAGLIK